MELACWNSLPTSPYSYGGWQPGPCTAAIPHARPVRCVVCFTARRPRSSIMADNGKYFDNGFMDEKPHHGGIKGIMQAVYNPQNGEFLGRSRDSWLRILVFYIIFYVVLGAIFGVSLWVFFQTIDPRIPKWQLTKSLIGTNPGLGFRPMPPALNVESSLIWYKGTDRDNYRHWVETLEKFIEVYKRPGLTPGRGQNIFNCDYNRYPPRGKVCDVDVRNWYPCTAENEFNYHKSGPCIFLKLNKIYNWRPEFFNNSRELPMSMPDELKGHIRALELSNPEKLNTIWVSCEGENPADKENVGKMSYIPQRGFPGYFFPYENSEGYLSPLLAINIERPKNGILINIQCKAWAKNIKHSTAEKMGLVHFELLID